MQLHVCPLRFSSTVVDMSKVKTLRAKLLDFSIGCLESSQAAANIGLTHLLRLSPALYKEGLPPAQGSVASQPPTSHDQAGDGEKTGPGFHLLLNNRQKKNCTCHFLCAQNIPTSANKITESREDISITLNQMVVAQTKLFSVWIWCYSICSRDVHHGEEHYLWPFFHLKENSASFFRSIAVDRKACSKWNPSFCVDFILLLHLNHHLHILCKELIFLFCVEFILLLL